MAQIYSDKGSRRWEPLSAFQARPSLHSRAEYDPLVLENLELGD